MKLYGRVVADDVRTRVVPLATLTASKRMTAGRARELPKINLIGGTVPAAYIIAEVDCGKGKFYSNIFGRLTNCGSDKVVKSNEWLATLARRFDTTVDTTALVSKYGERMQKRRVHRRGLY